MDNNIQSKKTILITGATGFVGQRLARELILKGYELKILSRNAKEARKNFPYPAQFHDWNPTNEIAPVDFLEGVHSVIHLAGEAVAGKRWSPARKKAILESRSIGTRNLVEGMSQAKNKASSFISASAIGIYGNRGEETLNEESAAGIGFLPEVCKAWEDEAFMAQSFCRTAALRIGIVLGTESGALAEMLPIFRLGLGGPIGNGKAWMSWIHIDDLVNLFIFALENDHISGPINAVAPTACRNSEFTQALSKAIKRPAVFPAPSTALKLAFGEMSEILLSSQKIIPKMATNYSFEFKFKSIDEALLDLLAPKGLHGAYTLRSDQFVPLSKEKVFEFFSDARNLESITPDWLHFKIEKISDQAIHQGTLIDYKLKVRGFPIKWRTLISAWNSGKSFEDKMLLGPYKDWDHTHLFYEIPGGTLVSDRVHYRLPASLLGDIVAALWVISDVRKIFNFRKEKISQVFDDKLSYGQY